MSFVLRPWRHPRLAFGAALLFLAVLAAGTKGQIARSDDGGTTWRPVPLPNAPAGTGVLALEATSGLVYAFAAEAA